MSPSKHSRDGSACSQRWEKRLYSVLASGIKIWISLFMPNMLTYRQEYNVMSTYALTIWGKYNLKYISIVKLGLKCTQIKLRTLANHHQIIHHRKNTQPQGYRKGNHKFYMHTFSRAEDCDYCGRLMKGLLWQGYACSTTHMVAHRQCIPALVNSIKDHVNKAEIQNRQFEDPVS